VSETWAEWDYGMNGYGRLMRRNDVTGMSFPVRCTRCGHVYDLGKVTVTGRYTDCSVWKCPGCGITVDDRPVGWGDHHYVELPKPADPVPVEELAGLNPDLDERGLARLQAFEQLLAEDDLASGYQDPEE
jgi:hypothetical protein